MSASYSSGSESLEADSTIGDHDSAIGGETASRTTSLTPSILDYRYENGRRYHAYLDGTYHLPNDDLEADRLDLQHHLFRLTTGGPLFLAPIDRARIHNVLDVGCGTGIWSMDFADEFPNANVLGIDLSPIQPTEIPPNCSFLVDNAEAEWAHDRMFDFIHSRAMCAGIKNWPKYIRQAYDNLAPGGWLELQEVSVPPRCDDGSTPADSSIMYCSNTLAKAATAAGLDVKAPARFKDLLRETGFVDIHIKRYKWPIGPWTKGSREKTLGRWALQDCLDALQGGTLGLFTRVLGWSVEEIEALLAEVRKEMKGQKSHCYMPVSFTYARKPLQSEETLSSSAAALVHTEESPLLAAADETAAPVVQSHVSLEDGGPLDDQVEESTPDHWKWQAASESSLEAENSSAGAQRQNPNPGAPSRGAREDQHEAAAAAAERD